MGLLTPASCTPAGYRPYSEADLAKLQLILFFKELDFGLAKIKEILDRPDFNRQRALAAHRGAFRAGYVPAPVLLQQRDQRAPSPRRRLGRH
ncbi:MAG TPA: MerR family transcriptional regulator [Firmicutes bacterium]|nr:MerR family transcriptional regulator [Bacillota bacterium]